MGNRTALDGEVTAVDGVLTDQHPLDFYALGLAGCIDRLTAPLRRPLGHPPLGHRDPEGLRVPPLPVGTRGAQ
jgi:hypothetical protein